MVNKFQKRFKIKNTYIIVTSVLSLEYILTLVFPMIELWIVFKINFTSNLFI